MVKFEVDFKQKLISLVRKALTDLTKMIESQAVYISIADKEIRFFNVVSTVNHEFHIEASLVLYLDEIAEKKRVSFSSESREINLSLNKVADLTNTLNFSHFYNEMIMRLAKDSHDNRSLRLKFAKTDASEMVYIKDCGIDFSNVKYQKDLNTQFELEIKSFYLKGIMDLSFKSSNDLLLNFNFVDNKLEITVPNQHTTMAISCVFTNKSELLDKESSVSYKMYYKFCKRLYSSLNFDGPLKIGISNNKQLYIDTNLLSDAFNEDGVIGKFRFVIPLTDAENEDGI